MSNQRTPLGNYCNRFATLTLVACLFLVEYTSSAVADNWPQFRGPAGNGTAEAANFPIEWSSDSNIAWKAALPGRGASSPIVWGDKVFLTAFTGFGTKESETDKSQLKLHVLCFDRATGEPIWDKSIVASEKTQDFSKRIQDHGYATSTPATDGEAVYAFFGVSGVVAYDMKGELLWHAEVGEKTAGFGSASSPVVHENLVIVNASIESQSAFAFDKKSGEQVWKISPVAKAWTSPCIAKTAEGKSELVINQIDVVKGFDPKTGEELWNCDGIDDYVVPVPVFHEGIVYCLGGRTNRSMAIKLGGRGDVTETHKLWQANIGANVTSPVYYNGHIYWASDKAVANCLDAKTGESIYRERLPTRARIYASMIRAGDRLIVTTRDQGVVVLKASPKYEELATNVIESDENLMNAGPAVAGDNLFLRTDSTLYCIGSKK
jgi:outer membrane protein assembly factor BamB